VSDAIQGETVRVAGHDGDDIPAYLARPLGTGAAPGVVVIHHMPGYDPETKEITRTFAVHGYLAICPNLHYRDAPDAAPGEAAKAARDAGGVPDDRCVGDVAGAAHFLRTFPAWNGKVGVIGYCSGGRQAYLCACRLTVFDAAVDCYGGRVVAGPDDLSARQPVAPIDLTPSLAAPLLGLFGGQDKNPSPEQVRAIDAVLTRHGKPHEFHTYPDAGHAFFSVDRPSYNVEAVKDGWQRIWAFFGTHLA
jgi:carboxymethylenebutenolidase